MKMLTVVALTAETAQAEADRIAAERGVTLTGAPEKTDIRKVGSEFYLWKVPYDDVRTIDITPTWSAILPILIGVLQNPEAPVSAHKEAEANLIQMARLADKYVTVLRESGHTNLNGLTPVLGDPDQKES